MCGRCPTSGAGWTGHCNRDHDDGDYDVGDDVVQGGDPLYATAAGGHIRPKGVPFLEQRKALAYMAGARTFFFWIPKFQENFFSDLWIITKFTESSE